MDENKTIQKIVLCIIIIFCFLGSNMFGIMNAISHFDLGREPIASMLKNISGRLIYGLLIIYPLLFFLVIYNYEWGFNGFVYTFTISSLYFIFIEVVFAIIRNQIKKGNYVYKEIELPKVTMSEADHEAARRDAADFYAREAAKPPLKINRDAYNKKKTKRQEKKQKKRQKKDKNNI